MNQLLDQQMSSMEMISENCSKRHSDEIKHRERVEWPFESWLESESIVPWNLREYGRVLQSYFPEGERGKHIAGLWMWFWCPFRLFSEKRGFRESF